MDEERKKYEDNELEHISRTDCRDPIIFHCHYGIKLQKRTDEDLERKLFIVEIETRLCLL